MMRPAAMEALKVREEAKQAMERLVDRYYWISDREYGPNSWLKSVEAA